MVAHTCMYLLERSKEKQLLLTLLFLDIRSSSHLPQHKFFILLCLQGGDVRILYGQGVDVFTSVAFNNDADVLQSVIECRTPPVIGEVSTVIVAHLQKTSRTTKQNAVKSCTYMLHPFLLLPSATDKRWNYQKRPYSILAKQRCFVSDYRGDSPLTRPRQQNGGNGLAMRDHDNPASRAFSQQTQNILANDKTLKQLLFGIINTCKDHLHYQRMLLKRGTPSLPQLRPHLARLFSGMTSPGE